MICASDSGRQADIAPWMDLLGAVIGQIVDDAVALRRRGILDPDGMITEQGERRYPKRAAEGLDLMALRRDAYAMAREQLPDAPSSRVRNRANEMYPGMKSFAVAQHRRLYPKAPVAPLKGRGLSRRPEVELVGRMIFQGGIDLILTRLGLEPFGWQIVAGVEQRTQAKGDWRSRL